MSANAVSAVSQCYWDELVWAYAIKVWANPTKVWANAIKIQDQHKKSANIVEEIDNLK